MPKLNINDATREELVEKAELRPELADAILEFRGPEGGLRQRSLPRRRSLHHA
jgi:hypothetical protein